MKGYIYITGSGTDPAALNNLNDPIFGPTPTLGGCMPNIRRAVAKGDYIFVVSGKVPGIQQYVVGGFRVEDKLKALRAYARFPENRLKLDQQGILQGNVLVDSKGKKHPLDRHNPYRFKERIENYIVGADALILSTPQEVALGRERSLEALSTILERPRSNRVIDVMARWGKLENGQVTSMLDWLQGIKAEAGR
jgi:hypothetical protein